MLLMFFVVVVLRHNSSLVCMVGVNYVYIDMLFGLMGTFFFNPS